MTSKKSFDRRNYELLTEKSCFVIDLDGVVYKGRQAIAGAREAIQKFREIGKNIVFLTNNSASSTETILQKLVGFGIECDRQELLTASQAAAIFIAKHQIDEGLGVLAIGTEALKAEIINSGLKLAEANHCGAVLVGLDPQFNYEAITIALKAIMLGAKFVVCNRDANYPVENGQLMAGCGAMVGAIEAATGRVADFEIGKPKTIMLDILVQRKKIDLTDCLVIGDMLASDILMANNAGIPSIWISETTAQNPAQNQILSQNSSYDSNKSLKFPQPSLCVSSLYEISQNL